MAAIRALVPLGLMHVQETLDQEVTALAGERYARKATATRGRRHGSNPGTVALAGQRVPIRVPRVRCVAGSEMFRRGGRRIDRAAAPSAAAFEERLVGERVEGLSQRRRRGDDDLLQRDHRRGAGL